MKDTINKGNYELWKKEMKEWNEWMNACLSFKCFMFCSIFLRIFFINKYHIKLDNIKIILTEGDSWTAGDILDPKIIDYLNEFAPSGLFRFEIGIQSINYETNYLVDRIQDNEKLFKNKIFSTLFINEFTSLNCW
mgnify:CR=1 FL=1